MKRTNIRSGGGGGRLPQTECPNHVALRFGLEQLEAAVEVDLPQSGLTTLMGGWGQDSDLGTRSKDILGMDRKVERLGKAGQ